MKKRLGCILLAAALCALPVDALELNEVRYASVARAALMAQIVQIPAAGSATGDVGDDNTWTGTNIFTTATTFGSAAAAANSWVTAANAIVFEGSSADDFETTLTITNPFADTTFTIGPSPDGNPWIGATAGDSAAAVDVDNVLLGSAAGTAIAGTGTDNVCIGDLSCATLTSGDQNVVIGADADLELATDNQAVAIGFAAVASSGAVSIGYQAGLGTATGAQKNVLIGYQAGDAAVHAAFDNNVGIGEGVFGSATGNATGNTVVGYLSGDVIVAGDFNTAIGGNSGLISDLDGGTALGYSALIHAANGTALGYLAESSDGVSVGYAAGDSAANVDVDNVFVGNSAGTAANGTSTDNTCLGDLACNGLTTGDGNVIIGADADLSVVTDSNSIAIGFGALAGGEGVSIGATAGDAQGAGDVDNVFIGSGAGTEATGTSTDNVCIGDLACDSLTTGDGNIVIGADSDVGSATIINTTCVGIGCIVYGNYGVAVGSGAEAAGESVVLGVNAGDAQAAADVQNTYVGAYSGTSANGTSVNNTCIGYGACATNHTTGDRVVVVGSSTDVGSAGDTDLTIIGESMVGKASDSILIGFGGQEYMYVHGAGKVITDATATAIVDISVADDTAGGATIEYTVTAVDTDEYQAERGAVYIAWENDSATESCAIGEIGTTVLAGGGSMAVTNACTVGLTDEVRWTFTADSSLGAPATTVTLYWSIRIDGPATSVTPQ